MFSQCSDVERLAHAHLLIKLTNTNGPLGAVSTRTDEKFLCGSLRLAFAGAVLDDAIDTNLVFFGAPVIR